MLDVEMTFTLFLASIAASPVTSEAEAHVLLGSVILGLALLLKKQVG
jgi:hypothetical protein